MIQGPHIIRSFGPRPAFPQLRMAAAAALMAFGLTGCLGGSDGGVDALPGAPTGEVTSGDLGTVGTGSVKVGLMLPLSATGNAGAVAASMKNAAELALAEFNGPDIQLVVKDDQGTPNGALAAAQALISEGAEIVVGPLFAPAVQSAGTVLRPAGKPMIAFSTDTNVAARGTYLLSFLPETDIARILEFAHQRGKRSVVAILPEDAYGTVVEAQLQETMAKLGGRVVGIERYPLDKLKMQDPVARAAKAASQADAILIPDAGDAAPTVVALLAANGVDLKRVQLLGSGRWDDPKILNEPSMVGGWYAAPDTAGFRNFTARYQAKYGQPPARTATLAYDAVSLIAALAKTQGSQRFTEQVLTNGSGFAGIDGIFRFRPDGTNERGLAVLQIMGGGATNVIAAAPKSFAAATQ